MFGLISSVSSALKANGVVGINERNGHFVVPFNKRRSYPLILELNARPDLKIQIANGAGLGRGSR